METFFQKTGDGKAIVYLHGWGASGDIFNTVARALPCYGNYLLDFAGFGQSAMPPETGFTVFDYARQLVVFLTENGLKDITIVAHSFGCRVAMIVASERPDLVERALLFAPAGLRRPSFTRWCKIRLYKLKKRLFKGKKIQGGSADYQSTSDALKSTFVKVVNQDLSAYARKMRCKTLIIAAKDDKAVPFKDAKRLHKLIENSEFVGIEGDHFALFYVPDSFAEIIKMFVAE